MGVSMEFTGEDKPSGATSMSRCDAVYAAALVDDPAANSSLFSVPATKAEQYLEEQTNTNNKMESETDDVKKDPTIADLMAKYEELGKRMSALEMPIEKMEIEIEQDDEEPALEMKECEEKTKSEEKEEDKKIEMAAKLGAESAIKLFAAKLGITNLGKAGPLNSNAKEKHFEEHVADLAVKEFSGDQGKARTAILTNTGKYNDAWNAYKAARLVKTA
jgi:hypothetical protein